MAEKSWNFYVHDDGHYASLNEEIGTGDTLLRIGGQDGQPGSKDVEKARRFEEWLRTERRRDDELDTLRKGLQGEVERLEEQAQRLNVRWEGADRVGRAAIADRQNSMRETADRLQALLDSSEGEK